jgi:translation initiation factor 1A
MPKNKTGGNKAKKQKRTDLISHERLIEFKDEGQEYAHITKNFGNNRYEAVCTDGKTRLSHGRGNLKKKKIFIKVNDVVIVSLRPFQDDKCDIIYQYTPQEISQLKKLGEIPYDFVKELGVGVSEKLNQFESNIEFVESTESFKEEEAKLSIDFNFDEI